MGRKRKLFLGTAPIGGKDMKSRRKARFVTSQYHNIRNELTAIDKDVDTPLAEKDRQKEILNEKLEAIGGVDKYQQASIISTSHFKTSRWVVTILEQIGMKKLLDDKGAISEVPSSGSQICTAATTSSRKLNVLEVGAINTQLQQCKWLNVRAIDVNSQHPSIEECDFFDIIPTSSFDAVVCSMVINCVTEPVMRGEMLARLYAHIKPVTGALFLVLPLRCVNSNHVGSGRFDSLLQGLGFVHLIEKRLTPRLVFYVLGRGENIGGEEEHEEKEKITKKKRTSSGSSSSSGSSASESVDWKDLVRSSAARSMKKKAILDHFCKDFDSVPSVEFSLSMSSVLHS